MQSSASKDKDATQASSTSSTNDEEAKDLPPEEFTDYLASIDADLGDESKSLDEILNQKFDINEGNPAVLTLFSLKSLVET